MLFTQFVSGIDGREQVFIVIESALQAFLIRTGVHNQFLTGIFIACSGVEAEGTYRNVDADITGQLSVFALIVIHVVHFFLHVELVNSIVGIYQYIVCHIIVKLESLRQAVIRLPAVLELAGVVGTCTVLAISTGFQSRGDVTELEILAIIYIC